MKVKQFDFTNENYHLFVYGWFMERFGNYTKDLLSDYGFMAIDNSGRPLVAMFFYPTAGTSMAFLGWPVSSKSSTKEQRDQAIPMILDEIEKFSKKRGYKFITSYASTDNMIKRLKNANYITGDTNCTQFYKGVK